MSGFIDIHTHTLPGVDDGSQSLKESLEILKGLEELGFDTVFCTPHQKQFLINPPMDSVKFVFKALKEEIEFPLKIHLGVENFSDQQFFDRLNRKKVPTLGKSSYVLFEFSPLNPVPNIEEIIFQLNLEGYSPIIAHVERYEWLSIEKIKKLKNSVQFQVNLSSFIKEINSERKRKRSIKLLDSGLIDYLATDIHTLALLPYIKRSLKWIRKNYGEKVLKKILRENQKTILKEISENRRKK
jgi:protein-tyrosine phosphatase